LLCEFHFQWPRDDVPKKKTRTMPKRQRQKKSNAKVKTKTSDKCSKAKKKSETAIDPYSKQNKRKLKSKTKVTSTHQYTFNDIDGASYEDITIHEDKSGEWGGDIGSSVWKVSYMFAKYLERLQSQQQFVSDRNHLFIELGAGTGILGMVIGRMNGKIICTEQQHSMSLLEFNLKANALYANGRVDCYPLHWGSHANYKLFDKKLLSFLSEHAFFKHKEKKLYIVIADCIYLGVLHAILLDTIQHICDAIRTELCVRGIKHMNEVEILMAYQQRNEENERNFWKCVNAEYATWTYRAIEIEDEVKRTYVQCFKKIRGLNSSADDFKNADDDAKDDDEVKQQQNADFITSLALKEFCLFSLTPTSTVAV